MWWTKGALYERECAAVVTSDKLLVGAIRGYTHEYETQQSHPAVLKAHYRQYKTVGGRKNLKGKAILYLRKSLVRGGRDRRW